MAYTPNRGPVTQRENIGYIHSNSGHCLGGFSLSTLLRFQVRKLLDLSARAFSQQ